MNILTFDIEEWFHILDNESTKTAKKWKNFEVRIHKNMERIFDILEKTNTKATFFCLGWIAETYPEVVKEIIKRGYEIGSHTRMHQLVYEQKPKEFERDLDYSIKTLEDISGKKIRYFRAPGFSINEESKFAFETLFEYGIEVDASIFPAKRAHGGFPSYSKAEPSLIKYNGITLKEFPINYASFFGKSIIYSGGGYFRLLPYALIKRWSRKSDYLMSYLHPRDFDPGQPMIKDLPLSRKFKSYVGLRSAEKKLIKWLTNFEFEDIQTAENKIDWSRVPIVQL
ncbi:MAG: polysaccharide deacetylase family protein [bacterium]